ncbi:MULTISPECIES: helix-turn-helix domain-containing protein [unclassified Streptomyces]|uniref:helix-turn-helix domain-containing protein n=1 Tax=unclassified Streptomyces TaxID=2593676 RepID=UPI001F03B503|nr:MULTISPECIES: helix-turn-helix domain-containing protein [unclassified Streptomyces]MCH0563293.1 helix-turn-helix domain-containing protein [Streptomyces sp. MUM 2J]MCH0568706.1 helix-turn-helix domain-containing protein [Streptomyces sp. MUM 136J]
MDSENPSAPPHAQSRVGANNHPIRRSRTRSGGLVHDDSRHSDRFTVIGNHLAQHPDLSLVAIGLATHLQSLPAGARVDIRSLAARFTKGTTRVAAALRELETHGYLRRERVRASDGRIVTRTTSCNRPGHAHGSREPARGASERPPAVRKRAPRKPLPAVPQPSSPAPALVEAATELLADLRRHDPRLLLSACDTAHLAPGVAAWLEREVSPGSVRRTLTAGLPAEGLRRPAALLAHRLAAQLPPPPPFRAPAPPPGVRHPLRNCDGCDRAFRSPEPGRCRACRAGSPSAQPRTTRGSQTEDRLHSDAVTR